MLSLAGKRGEVEHDARILGSGDFVQAMLQEADEKIARQMRHQGGKRSAASVIQEICQEADVNEEELLRGGRRRRVSEARANIAYRLSREMGLSLAEIARRLGVGTSAVAMAIRKNTIVPHSTEPPYLTMKAGNPRRGPSPRRARPQTIAETHCGNKQ